MTGSNITICPIDELVDRSCEVVKLTFLEDLFEGLFPVQFESDLDSFVKILKDDLVYISRIYMFLKLTFNGSINNHSSLYFFAVPFALSTGYFSPFFLIFSRTMSLTLKSYLSASKKAKAKMFVHKAWLLMCVCCCND